MEMHQGSLLGKSKGITNSGTGTRTTPMPAHLSGYPDWKQNIPLVSAGHFGATVSHTYIAMLPKYSEAIRASTSPTYRDARAYEHGNQPYDSRELWIAKRTPATPRLLVNQQGNRPSNMSASVLQAQQTLALLTQNLRGS